MKIDESYLLPKTNYNEVENIKKQIIIGNTFNYDMRHIIGWLNRFNGKNKKTAAFTIDAAGVVYKHFEPSYQSEYFDDLELNNKSIVILLENEGWLTKNQENNEFISWLGHIYKGEEVFHKKWREYSYWSPYTEEQINSALILAKELCKEFYIPLTAMTHNTKVEGLEDYKGILYKSNLSKKYTDVSPAFDFDYFTNNI
jgi:N-acetyl-anhydromuramyl-L-alanine amidase AmpD